MKIVQLSLIVLYFITPFYSHTHWYDSVQEKLHSLNKQLHPYSNYLKTAGAATAAVGAGIVAYDLLPIKQIITGASCIGLTGAALYGYKYLQHKKQLNDIQSVLDNSLNYNSLNPKDFRFCAWKQNTPNTNWSTSDEIINNKEAVCKQLEKDAKAGVIKIFDKWEKPLSPALISSQNIITAINEEQQELESYLKIIDSLSGISKIFVNTFAKIDLFNEISQSSLSNNEKIKAIANLLLTYQVCNDLTDSIILVIQETKEQYNNSILMQSYNPFNWTIAPHEQYSFKVYGDLFKAYVRLLAIKQAALQLNFSKTIPVVSMPQQLLATKQLLQQIINFQPLVDGNINEQNKQIHRLVALQEKMNDLKKLMNPESINIIDKILQELKAIGIQIHQAHYEWTGDIINRLNNIKTQLETIKI